MINKVILVGRLGKDPDIRYTKDGNAVTSFSLATTNQWKDKNGEKQESTEWHNCVAFNRLGEVCGEYLQKGNLVYIEGTKETKPYDKDGQTHYYVSIKLKEMKILDNKKEGRGEDTSFNPEDF